MTSGEEHVSFYYEIGIAITQWVHVERALLLVVQSCLADSEWKAVMVGFFSIENFRSKLAFVDNIVRHKHAANPLIARWAELHAITTKCATARNGLAHRSPVIFSSGADQQGRRIALVEWMKYQASDWESKVKDRPPSGSLCLRDIVLIRQEFFAAHVALRNFSYALSGQPEPYPKSAEQVGSLPTIRTLGNQIRALLELPPKPSRK